MLSVVTVVVIVPNRGTGDHGKPTTSCGTEVSVTVFTERFFAVTMPGTAQKQMNEMLTGYVTVYNA